MARGRDIVPLLRSHVTDCCQSMVRRRMRIIRLPPGGRDERTETTRRLEPCTHFEATVADAATARNLDFAATAVGKRDTELLARIQRLAVQECETATRSTR